MIETVAPASPAYPDALRRRRSPGQLRVAGDLTLLSRGGVAIAGSRRASDQQKQCAQEIGAALAAREKIVVSGMAVGVDAAAHTGALMIAKASTIGVLGCRLRSIGASSRQLARLVIERGGTLVSELSDDARASNSALIRRNHTIVALSEALIVVAAELSSGSMWAVRFAAERGIPILCPTADAGAGVEALLGSPGQLLERSSQFRGFKGATDDLRADAFDSTAELLSLLGRR